MKITKCKFKIIKLVDSRKQGSELEVGNTYVGELHQGVKTVVWYKDKTDTDWCFYPGDTCEVVEEEKTFWERYFENIHRKEEVLFYVMNMLKAMRDSIHYIYTPEQSIQGQGTQYPATAARDYSRSINALKKLQTFSPYKVNVVIDKYWKKHFPNGYIAGEAGMLNISLWYTCITICENIIDGEIVFDEDFNDGKLKL